MLQEFQHHILPWFLHTGICKILQHRKYRPYKQPPNLMEVDERISKSLPTCERQVPKDVIKPVSWRTRRKVLRMHGFVQCKQKSKNKGHVRYCLVFLVIMDPSSKIEALTVCFNKIRWSTRVASTWWMIMSQLHIVNMSRTAVHPSLARVALETAGFQDAQIVQSSLIAKLSACALSVSSLSGSLDLAFDEFDELCQLSRLEQRKVVNDPRKIQARDIPGQPKKSRKAEDSDSWSADNSKTISSELLPPLPPAWQNR